MENNKVEARNEGATDAGLPMTADESTDSLTATGNASWLVRGKNSAYDPSKAFEKEYAEAEELHRKRSSFAEDDVPGRLDNIVQEVKARNNIEASQIFLKGQALFEARELFKKHSEKVTQTFKNWIKDNFDFGYETAINLIHVYTYCSGNRANLNEVPWTILYKISQPSFPDALRAYLFEHDAEGLRKMSNRNLDDLIRKYKEEGQGAVDEVFRKHTEYAHVFNQAAPILNLEDEISRYLEIMRRNLEQKMTGHSGNVEKPVGSHQVVRYLPHRLRCDSKRDSAFRRSAEEG